MIIMTVGILYGLLLLTPILYNTFHLQSKLRTGFIFRHYFYLRMNRKMMKTNGEFWLFAISLEELI